MLELITWVVTTFNGVLPISRELRLPADALNMGDNTKDKSRKHKHHSRDKDEEKKSKKRHRHDRDDEDSGRMSKKHKHRKEEGLTVVDDDLDEGDMWVEKNIDMDGERVSHLEFSIRILLMFASSH